jgi:hypothetical protein
LRIDVSRRNVGRCLACRLVRWRVYEPGAEKPRDTQLGRRARAGVVRVARGIGSAAVPRRLKNCSVSQAWTQAMCADASGPTCLSTSHTTQAPVPRLSYPAHVPPPNLRNVMASDVSWTCVKQALQRHYVNPKDRGITLDASGHARATQSPARRPRSVPRRLLTTALWTDAPEVPVITSPVPRPSGFLL